MASIVMTGGTSGIGLVAAKSLLARNNNLTVGVRNGKLLDGATSIDLDLNSLSNVRQFASKIAAPIDVLILNAGLQRLDVRARTHDGFEETFGVNHLGHYLLVQLLLPKMAIGGRVVFTTSGTHDPEEKTGMPAPRHADAKMLANPESDPTLSKNLRITGLRAYSSSKLANLMTAITLSEQAIVKNNGIAVNAYDPGLTPATGLARQHPMLVRIAFKLILPMVRPFFAGMNSVENAGNALAGLADGSITGSSIYMALRSGKPTWPKPSALARNVELRSRLWNDSAELVSIAAQ